jgi:hypothetical protein
MKSLNQHLNDYLKLRRQLGYKLQEAELFLRNFIGFIEQEGTGVITAKLAVRWATRPNLKPAQNGSRLSVVRLQTSVRGLALSRFAAACGLRRACCVGRSGSLPRPARPFRRGRRGTPAALHRHSQRLRCCHLPRVCQKTAATEWRVNRRTKGIVRRKGNWGSGLMRAKLGTRRASAELSARRRPFGRCCHFCAPAN